MAAPGPLVQQRLGRSAIGPPNQRLQRAGARGSDVVRLESAVQVVQVFDGWRVDRLARR